MHIQAYLSFEGRCAEAIEFYETALGAKVDMMMRHQDSPDSASASCMPPGSENKVMHAAFRVGETTVLASDGLCSGKPNFQGISLSLTAKDDADAERLFQALADGGRVHQPLIKTFFSSRFGVLADRFGVSWMVLTAPAAG